MPKYTIEARSLNVVGVAGHDFWVLRDEQGKALAEYTAWPLIDKPAKHLQ